MDTRRALMDAARTLFAERGFAAAGREDIVERAGVTRGALYHHFDSKAAVAVAVVQAVEAQLAERVIRAARRAGDDPRQQLHRSARAYVDACAEPDIARVLLEAPLVLGPDELRAMNEATCVHLLEPVLAHLDVVGDTATAARLVLGMLDAAAILVATDPRSRRRVNATVDAFLDQLLPG
jgi:AcrR family transcriptional regulator